MHNFLFGFMTQILINLVQFAQKGIHSSTPSLNTKLRISDMQQNCTLTIWRERIPLSWNSLCSLLKGIIVEALFHIMSHKSHCSRMKSPLCSGGGCSAIKFFFDQVHFRLWKGPDCYLPSKAMHLLLF